VSLNTLDGLREAVKGLEWRFAQSMPKHPHWYIQRDPAIEDIYVALFQATKDHGVWERFFKYRVQYLYLGDGFKYWRMTNNLDISRILNRAHDNAVHPSGR